MKRWNVGRISRRQGVCRVVTLDVPGEEQGCRDAGCRDAGMQGCRPLSGWGDGMGNGSQKGSVQRGFWAPQEDLSGGKPDSAFLRETSRRSGKSGPGRSQDTAPQAERQARPATVGATEVARRSRLPVIVRGPQLGESEDGGAPEREESRMTPTFWAQVAQRMKLPGGRAEGSTAGCGGHRGIQSWVGFT